MLRRTLIWMMGILLGSAAAASAGQAPSGDPRVEAGVGISATGGDYFGTSAVNASARLNIDAHNGLAVTFDRDAGGRERRYSDLVDVSYRRVLHRFTNGSIAGTIGGAWTETWEHYVSPYYSYPNPRPVSYEYTRLDHRAWATTGVEVDWRVARYLTVQSSFRLGITKDAPFLRVATGVAVPIGTVPARAFERRSRPLDDRLAQVQRGQTLWITTPDGREIKTEAISVASDRVTFTQAGGATTMALTDIRTIETTDHVRDGAGIGLAIGGIGGGLIAGLSCHCDEYTFLSILAGSALGGGLGAMSGLIGDSIHAGRRTVYETRRPAAMPVALSPIVGRHQAGVSAVWRW